MATGKRREAPPIPAPGEPLPLLVLEGLEGNPPAGELNATQELIDAATPFLVPFWWAVIGLSGLNMLRVLVRDWRVPPGPDHVVWSPDEPSSLRRRGHEVASGEDHRVHLMLGGVDAE